MMDNLVSTSTYILACPLISVGSVITTLKIYPVFYNWTYNPAGLAKKAKIIKFFNHHSVKAFATHIAARLSPAHFFTKYGLHSIVPDY